MTQQSTQAKLDSIPTWITKDYLQDKLRKRYNESYLNITDVQVNAGSSKGENYTSTLLRMKLIYRIGNSSDEQNELIIVKRTVSGDNVQSKVMNEYDFYTREMKMYEQILPRLHAVLLSAGDKDQISPKTIHVNYDHASIIFEDLKEGNFSMADRLERLDMDHAMLALKKLAKFHASAAVLNQKSPELFEQGFDRGMFNRHTQALKPMITGILAALIRYIIEQPELKEKYYEKLLSLQDRIMEYCERVFDVNRTHFMTLIHGDFWHMNMMFKYANIDSKKKPIDVVPLDYQCSVWASPTVDLHYFFNTSLNEELRQHQQAKLVQYYYKALVETLKTLNYQGKIPSLFEFRMQMEIRCFYGLFSAFIFQPIMICPDTEDADFMNLISDTEAGIRFKDTLFKNVKVQKYLAELLPKFDQIGLLDNMDSK